MVINMADIFAVRDLDKKVQNFIYDYAHDHDLKVAEAIQEVVKLAQERMKEKEQQKQKKKYRSFFDVYDKLKFRGDPHLSEKIDDIVYGEE